MGLFGHGGGLSKLAHGAEKTVKHVVKPVENIAKGVGTVFTGDFGKAWDYTKEGLISAANVLGNPIGLGGAYGEFVDSTNRSLINYGTGNFGAGTEAGKTWLKNPLSAPVVAAGAAAATYFTGGLAAPWAVGLGTALYSGVNAAGGAVQQHELREEQAREQATLDAQQRELEKIELARRKTQLQQSRASLGKNVTSTAGGGQEVDLSTLNQLG